MIYQTDYYDSDLSDGTCRSCNEETRVVEGDGRCPDCIEEQKFYEMTMSGLNDNRRRRDDEDDPEDDFSEEEE